MGMFERIGQRGDPFGGPAESGTSDGELVGEVAALDQGADQVRLAVDLAGVVDRDDVGMPQAAATAGLAEEPLDGPGAVERPGPGPLQGHGAIQRGIPRPVDDPEGTLADHVPQLVSADAGRRPRH